MLDFNEFNLSLIRHGQSAINVLPDRMGQAVDVPLTDHGKMQAAFLSERLFNHNELFDLVYSSNCLRAIDTAKITTGLDDKIVIASELQEYNAGDWENASRKETLTDDILLKMGYLNNSFQPPHGESMNQVERRASAWLEENILYNSNIIRLANERRQSELPQLNLAIFSHGMTIKCLLHYIMGFDKSFTWKINLENTSISKLSFDKQGWKLQSINDYAHLL